MKIWIDLANSPHVVFFMPIIEKLKLNGHEIFITMRDFAQTVSLAERYNIKGITVGRHGGSNMIMKAVNFCIRTGQLLLFAKGKSFDIAVSHNSYTHIIASRLAGAKVITIMDYEGQPANHLAFRFAHKVIVPQSFPDQALRKFGALPHKVFKYNGFKEQVYLSNFQPDMNFAEDLMELCGLDKENKLTNKTVVTVRTPATMAVYHQFENPLFEKLLEHLNSQENVFTVILPRTPEQKVSIKKKYPNLFIPKKVLDGRNLTSFSDMVISAGGTMNREAAILGTPAYSVFAGNLPAVDRELVNMGRMFHIDNEKRIKDIIFNKKNDRKTMFSPSLSKKIIDKILSLK